MQVRNNNKKINLSTGMRFRTIGLLISVISLFVGIHIWNDNPTNIYEYIFLLPIFFSILSIVLYRIFDRITIVSVIIIALMFIRYVASPLMLSLENYPIGIYHIEYNKAYVFRATIIMLYEMLVIFYCLYRTSLKERRIKNNTLLIDNILGKENFSRLNIIMWGVIGVTALLYVTFPVLLNEYSFIFNSDINSLTVTNATALQGLPNGIGWLGNVLGEVTRCILMEFIIIWCFKKYSRSGRHFYWWISILLTLINALITTSRIMIGLFTSLVLIIEIYYLYPRKRKLLLVAGVVGGCLSFIAIASIYLEKVLTYHSMSQMIQDYTNGFYNVYQACAAYNEYRIDIIDRIVMFWVGDGIGNINPLNVFIRTRNSADIFNYYLYNMEFNGGAVIPLVSQTSYYFSAYFGPILTAPCIFLAKKYEINWRSGNGCIIINGLLSIVWATLPFMYNYSSFIHIVSSVIIPLWLCSLLNKKFR